jgi:hypothetical protein
MRSIPLFRLTYAKPLTCLLVLSIAPVAQAQRAEPAPPLPSSASSSAPVPATTASAPAPKAGEVAGDAPVQVDTVPILASDPPSARIAKSAYNALLADANADTIAGHLEDALAAAAKPCKQVNAYQIVAVSTGSRGIRVKCQLEPVYRVSVDAKGVLLVSGGDGSLPSLQPGDGNIVEILGQTADRYIEKQSSEPVLPVAPPREILDDPLAAKQTGLSLFGLSGLPLILTVMGVALALVLLFALWSLSRARRRWGSGVDNRTWATISRNKDELLEECWEIYPSIFKHPRGFFIARGKTGKRRFFGSAMTAILYRDFGVRLGEITVQ